MLGIFGPQLSYFGTTHACPTSTGSLTQVSEKQQKGNNKNNFKSTKYKLYNIAHGFIEYKCACVCFYNQ